MADLLIKGMEMPKGNNVLVVDSAGTITKVNRWPEKVEATDPFSVKAVALPEHGRLIDADALKKHMTDLLRHDYVFDEVGCFGLVKDAPTVLEASE